MDGETLDLGNFGQEKTFDKASQMADYFSGGSGGIVWERYSTTESTDLGFSQGSKDQIHQVKVRIGPRLQMFRF